MEDQGIAVAENQNQPIWITVPACKPGVLKGVLTARWTGGAASQPFSVRVQDIQWIVYPRDGKLLSSIRLEAMRDGIGDYELLSMLAERNAAAAQKLAAETILDFNRYDTDVARFRAWRCNFCKAW